MNAIEIARRLAELNETNKAQKAYILALSQEGLSPEEELEGASYLFFSESDYKLPFTHFVSLFNRGCFQAEILELMTQAFYLPNVKRQQKQYEKNVKALSDYPYLFRKSFPAFEELPILFFPFDDEGFVPYFPAESHFGDYVNFNDTVIDRWFFQDLSKPILADDVYSQYQLEYLNDNVRKSEWVAKENHIYLHYSNWETFCAYLSVLDLKQLLTDEKIVFLIEDEIQLYPIDFKSKYGIDYEKYPIKPIGVREVNKLIWHTQLASHNGGDFFNEIFYDHPNLIACESIMFDSMQDLIKKVREILRSAAPASPANRKEKIPASAYALRYIQNPTDKDVFVSLFLHNNQQVSKSDPSSRIVPALFFQPHFKNIQYRVDMPDITDNEVTLYSQQYEEIKKSPIFKNFKYIKTFTPMRRPTTSYAATVRFVVEKPHLTEEEKNEPKQRKAVSDNQLLLRLTNRSFMIDRWDRLYRDSRLIRFEDGKLNPRATFTALAEFLDIPYTESMTYCSNANGVNEVTLRGSMRGFDASAVYRTYDEFADDAERSFLEYFMRDVYETYGYDFHYYKGETVDEEWVKEKTESFHQLFYYVDKTMRSAIRYIAQEEAQELDDLKTLDLDQVEQENEEQIQNSIREMRKRDLELGKLLLRGLRFINREGQPLQMMKPLELDPALLEQPLYH